MAYLETNELETRLRELAEDGVGGVRSAAVASCPGTSPARYVRTRYVRTNLGLARVFVRAARPQAASLPSRGQPAPLRLCVFA